MNIIDKLKAIFLIILAIAVVAMSSCEKDGDKNQNDEKATLAIRLTDAPADYDAVKIDVTGLEIHTAGGWKPALGLNKGTYNLLNFTNGLDTLLGAANLPSGQVTEMRLFLGTDNSIIVNGISHPLKTPSAMQSGLKFKLNQYLEAGQTYEVWIDFDAGRSVVEAGDSANVEYLLKPVIRTFAKMTSGSISGMISPAVASSYVMAINGTDTAGTIPNSTGYYLIRGLTPGNYQVKFMNSSMYSDTTVNNIGVVPNAVTDMGTIMMKGK